ncbi:MBL fold metallo-hydrolase [Mucilaginibacter auburnensis]|uniref:Phosphoribosyl 1,2-cyclic phosphodiesterase n=1 Tax=Mucilaginibacter auburnensis TaxID=1457233 RepID=A0A2H9VR22_9SPHI|nr:MBL fold metallo-hydrolase [Mucilaginibacter auburnensis]PJJ83261.1 phosphoribosyl 1,2-cyclic phosphodiesterase [Mucilaginibacter auburnensis]
MSVWVASLNSGSNGNCYYIGNEHEAVLIDAGISCRETEARMARLGLSMRKVSAIFISHEHSDHIRGLTVLAKKYNLPVYITPPTLFRSGLQIDGQLLRTFSAEEAVSVGSLSVIPFSKIHDAAHPHSFTVTCGDLKVGVFTDLGVVCENLISHFQQCHAAFLEANYDDDMLEQGRYPYHLKRRIRGGQGHLSNKQALALFESYRPSFMSHLFLSHLSKDNNCPDLALNLFKSRAATTEVIVASRYEETALYRITAAQTKLPPAKAQYVLF